MLSPEKHKDKSTGHADLEVRTYSDAIEFYASEPNLKQIICYVSTLVFHELP